ncbi:MAG: restriction endonuclease subunit S [Verrucomicrobiota bacterium JB025]|nr:restriction endonuclease subunit S [Verrucomicrobiota bacterium JB025]
MSTVEENLHGGVGLVHITKGNLEKIQIPLPPLEVQKEIVAEIEGYQKVIDGARAVIDNYRPHIPIHPDWPMVELGELADIQLGKMLDRKKHTKGRLFPYLRNLSVRWGKIDTHNLPQMHFQESELDRFDLKAGDVVVCEGGSYPGRAAVWDGHIPNMKYQKALHRVRFKIPFEPYLLVAYLRMIDGTSTLESLFSGSTIKHLTRVSFSKMRIPHPPMATQQAIVADIEAEQSLVAANRELIERMEKKIQAAIARVWGEEKGDD